MRGKLEFRSKQLVPYITRKIGYFHHFIIIWKTLLVYFFFYTTQDL